eukprot:4008262-Amphidinium_carterae.1
MVEEHSPGGLCFAEDDCCHERSKVVVHATTTILPKKDISVLGKQTVRSYEGFLQRGGQR